jgi:hypothetical protein
VLDALKSRGLWPEPPPSAPRRRIVAEYNYTDEAGRLLYQVVRTEPKGFFQRRPNGNGWINRKSPRQVLYHLREVLEAAIVFVCEGEKDESFLIRIKQTKFRARQPVRRRAFLLFTDPILPQGGSSRDCC